MANFILVTKLVAGESDKALGINVANVIEVADYCVGTSRLKYWDGKTVRSAVIKESPQQVIVSCNR